MATLSEASSALLWAVGEGAMLQALLCGAWAGGGDMGAALAALGGGVGAPAAAAAAVTRTSVIIGPVLVQEVRQDWGGGGCVVETPLGTQP